MSAKQTTFKITFIAVMTAVATVIYMIFPEIPLVPGVDYLKLDFSDIPAILAGITAGPISGIAVEVIKNIIHLTRTTTYGIGEIMNIGMGTAMILSLYGFTKLFSRLFKKKYMAASSYYVSAVLAVVCSIFAGWLLNAVFTPIYFAIAGIPLSYNAVMAGVWGSTLLNTIKSAFNVLPFYPVYFAVYKAYTKISG